MDKTFRCRCAIKIDLENAADVFDFLEENYPIPSLMENFKNLSPEEQRCTCCLLGTALLRLQEERRRKKGLFWWLRRKLGIE